MLTWLCPAVAGDAVQAVVRARWVSQFVCVFMVQRRDISLIYGAFGGERRGVWMCLLICDSLLFSKGPLISIYLLLFSLHHPASRGYGSPGHLPSSRSDVSKVSLLPLTSPVLPLYSLVPKHQTCFQYFHIQEGMLLLEVVFICSATRSRCDLNSVLWHGFCNFHMVISFPVHQLESFLSSIS